MFSSLYEQNQCNSVLIIFGHYCSFYNLSVYNFYVRFVRKEESMTSYRCFSCGKGGVAL